MPLQHQRLHVARKLRDLLHLLHAHSELYEECPPGELHLVLASARHITRVLVSVSLQRVLLANSVPGKDILPSALYRVQPSIPRAHHDSRDVRVSRAASFQR